MLEKYCMHSPGDGWRKFVLECDSNRTKNRTNIRTQIWIISEERRSNKDYKNLCAGFGAVVWKAAGEEDHVKDLLFFIHAVILVILLISQLV